MISDATPTPTTNKRALGHIVLTLIFSISATGILASTLPTFITQLTHKENSGSESDIKSASMSHGILLSLASFIQLFVSPLLGSLSDQYGRRSIILFQLLSYSLMYACLVLADVAQSFSLVIVSRIINGVTGSILMSSLAYISDHCTVEDRSKSFGLAGFSFGIGFSVSPMIGGIVAAKYGISHALVLGWVLCIVALLYAFVFIRNSKGGSPLLGSSQQNGAIDQATLGEILTHPIKHLTFSFKLLFFNTPSSFWLALCMFFTQLANEIFYSVWVLYSTLRFGFTTKDNGVFLFCIGIGFSIMQGYVMRKILANPTDEIKLIRTSILCAMIMHLTFALSSQVWPCYVVLIVGVIGGMIDPLLKSNISKKVDARHQGSLQGAISSLNLSSKIVASLIGTFSFSNLESIIPGIPFYLSVISFCLSLLCLHKVTVRK